jgi:hypothetical protein
VVRDTHALSSSVSVTAIPVTRPSKKLPTIACCQDGREIEFIVPNSGYDPEKQHAEHGESGVVAETIVELFARAGDSEVDAKQPISAYLEAPWLPC